MSQYQAEKLGTLTTRVAALEQREELRRELQRFAVWISPVWEAGNEDDEDKALRAVDAFLTDAPEATP